MGIGFRQYWRLVFARFAADMLPRLVWLMTAVLVGAGSAFLLDYFGLVQKHQILLRVLIAAIAAIIIVGFYLIAHVLRAPWMVHRDAQSEHASVVAELQSDAHRGSQREQELRSSLDELRSRVGRPHVDLTFKDVDYAHEPGEPGVAFEDRTEFTATCTEKDAFGIYIGRVQIGGMWIQSRSCVGKIPCGGSAKMEYVVLYFEKDPKYSCECINLEFKGHLRDLFEKTLEKSGEDYVDVEITVGYSDVFGERYETVMRLWYTQGMFDMPTVTPISTKRLSIAADSPDSPPPESTTHAD